MLIRKILPFLIIFVFIFLSGGQMTQAVSLVQPCADPDNCNPCDFIKIFVTGADIIVMLTGIMSIVMFVFGGIIMITAYGNEARVKWGKDVLIATVIGIVIVMLAWTLVNTVILALYGGSSAAFNKFLSATGFNESNWSACPQAK